MSYPACSETEDMHVCANKVGRGLDGDTVLERDQSLSGKPQKS